MTFSDGPYEEARMKHAEHKQDGVEYKEGCRMCRFYGKGDES